MEIRDIVDLVGKRCDFNYIVSANSTQYIRGTVTHINNMFAYVIVNGKPQVIVLSNVVNIDQIT